jgi:hypothetical protein
MDINLPLQEADQGLQNDGDGGTPLEDHDSTSNRQGEEIGDNDRDSEEEEGEDSGGSVDGQNSDEDASSELSEGQDLRVSQKEDSLLYSTSVLLVLRIHQEDLEAALEEDLDFTGSYYYAANITEAPNPCLTIDDWGPIGLPISLQDAKSIISRASRAPFGHGDRTVVDTVVRDTWEIEPTRVRFGNPAWAKYVQTSVLPAVCRALGIAPSTTARCSLYKILLYETGSQYVLLLLTHCVLTKIIIVFFRTRSKSPLIHNGC